MNLAINILHRTDQTAETWPLLTGDTLSNCYCSNPPWLQTKAKFIFFNCLQCTQFFFWIHISTD